ncbi:MAG: peptide deformylase [Candidatus Bipolaricaulis sp.]|nr:peptide deformylase [Candidatus Bipolaricaulis sp.]MDY0392113.1 peptide deformylase [Candidatus Bipolaricaulis sp.]
MTYPSPILRRPTRPVEPGSREARDVADALRAAFAEIEAHGLAANQIGLPVRAALVRLGDEEWVFFNPEIIARSEELEVEWEGCLSLPGVEAEVPRAKEVVVRALDETGAPVELHLSELEARILQHEVDHLDGELYVDLLPRDERRRVLAEFRAARDQREKRVSSLQ